MPDLTPGQKFYEKEADALFGGCSCPDDSGSCDWCHVYYNGPDDETAADRSGEASS